MSIVNLVKRSVLGCVFIIVGVAFFFAIIGVFGLTTAVFSLVVFVSISIALITKTNGKGVQE